uniref:E3 ubiquitin-protein ligase n=1 Tax=Anas platyrhynchos platyrhynchos TaxID=8840 RepID=U3I8F4_ANAPP
MFSSWRISLEELGAFAWLCGPMEATRGCGFFFSGVVAKAWGESARIKSRWTEQTPAGCCAGAVPLHQPISISALPAWLLRAINQSRQQLLYPQRAVGPRGCRFPAPRGSPAWRWLERKGGSGAKRVGEGLPKRVAPSPLHLHVPKTERLWARWPWGRSHPGDEATLGMKPPRATRGQQLPVVPAPLSLSICPSSPGSYFANHFIMGGEKFDSTHPEGYLFGENSDLNFLGNRPVLFPYAAPPPQEPVKTLRSLINIRKDTLRLVKCSEEVKTPGEEVSKAKVHYNVEFTFDTDARVAITIYYQASEEFHNGVASYVPRDSSLQSETVHYKRGVCQQFCVPSHTVDPSEWTEEELGFDLDREVFPMVVHAVVDEGDEHAGHSHVLLATFEKHADGTFCVKPLKQKQVVDGVSYLLQEIYGIENKYNTQDSKVAEDEVSDNSAECVVCLSDVRDTLILPCRHLCLCNTCADTLRYQANNCPICRLPFRALLQIRAMRKKLGPLSPTSFNPIIASQTSDSEEHSSSENIPPGYEVVSLLEALNGPLTPSPGAVRLRALGDAAPPRHGAAAPLWQRGAPAPPARPLAPRAPVGLRPAGAQAEEKRLQVGLAELLHAARGGGGEVVHRVGAEGHQEEISCPAGGGVRRHPREREPHPVLIGCHRPVLVHRHPALLHHLLSRRARQQQPGPVRHVHGVLAEPALAAQHRHRLLHVRLLRGPRHGGGRGHAALARRRHRL